MEKVLIIGGVAAGTKAAAKIKRENPKFDVTIITKDEHISYAGCGLPYYIGGVIEDKRDLVVKTPEEFQALTGAKVFIKHEALDIDKKNKKVKVLDLTSEELKEFSYDKLLIATGASPFIPALDGINLKNIYTIRKVEDALNIREAIQSKNIKRAVVVGGGFIGLEVAENLAEQGVRVTIFELDPHILPGFDADVAAIAQEHLLDKGVMVLTNEKVTALEGTETVERVITDNGKIKTDLVIMSIGVKPNVELAKKAGIELGVTGAIKINEYMETSTEDIYAVGDCAENINLITNSNVWYPMGSTANKMGRIAALNITNPGNKDSLKGVLGTTVVKLFDLNACKTGISERDAKKLGYDAVSVLVPANDKAHYYPGFKMVATKLIADKATHKILGAQIIGQGVVDKPIDIIATAITFGGKVEDLEKLDLAYAPPFSMAMSSTIVASNVLLNKLNGKVDTISQIELKEKLNEVQIIDVRDEAAFNENSIEGAINIPLSQLGSRANEINKDKEIVLTCKIGKNAYLAYLKLKDMGYENIKILDGGISAYIA